MLLHLSKFGKAVEFLIDRKHLIARIDYWVICSIAFRKRHMRDKAQECILEAIKLDPHNSEVEKEIRILNRMKERPESIASAVNLYKKSEVHLEVDYFDARKEALKVYDASTVHCEGQRLNAKRATSGPMYRILSVDAGGIKGIIPALWMSVIEARTHRPISHNFELVAGPSTGGVLVLGSAMPSELSNEAGLKYYSKQIPKYRASDLLEMYCTRGSQIFVERPGNSVFGPLNQINQSRYTDARSTLFREHFGHIKMNQMLTDIVVPAVLTNSEIEPRTQLFTRRGLKNVGDDHVEREIPSAYDAAMSTTAAPTYFSAHDVKRKEEYEAMRRYVDGALRVNHPALIAYEEAISYKVPAEKLLLVTMGTGNHVASPVLKPGDSDGLFFWAKNLHKFISNECEIDRIMHGRLGDRYHRLQVWHEEEITMDQYDDDSVNKLVNSATQYIEEMDAADSNSINKLVERLLDEEGVGTFKPSSSDPDRPPEVSGAAPRSASMASPAQAAEPLVFSAMASSISSRKSGLGVGCEFHGKELGGSPCVLVKGKP